MNKTVLGLVILLLLTATTGFVFFAGHGILHGFVTNSSGEPVTDLTAVVTHLEGQWPYSDSQALTATGEFVLGPTVGSYLIELQDESDNVVAYRTGINIYNNITTFQFITVDLPSTCQTNLGFGTSGGMTLSLCGDDLTTAGSSAALSIYNATPNSIVYMPIGLTAAPTPFEGGTLVPLPWLSLLALPTSNTGTVDLVAPGGAVTPVTLYLQVVDTIGPSFRFSNAIEVVIGI